MDFCWNLNYSRAIKGDCLDAVVQVTNNGDQVTISHTGITDSMDTFSTPESNNSV